MDNKKKKIKMKNKDKCSGCRYVNYCSGSSGYIVQNYETLAMLIEDECKRREQL